MPYPTRPVKKATSIDAIELFPVAMEPTGSALRGGQPRAVRLQTGRIPLPRILFIFRAHNVENTVSPEVVAQIYGNIPLIVAFAVEPDLSVNLADIVFPDLHHLERLGRHLPPGKGPHGPPARAREELVTQTVGSTRWRP